VAITFIGSVAAAGTNAVLPAHQAGDIIFASAYQGLNNTQTITLADGYTAVAGQSGVPTNSQAMRVAYKIAQSNAETSGEWTGAEEVIFHVYRGVDPATPIGGSSTMNSTGSVTFATFALAIADGSSWVAGFSGWRSISTNLATSTFPGLTQRNNVAPSGGASRAVSFDTAGPVTSFPDSVASNATGIRYRTVAVEMRAASTATGGAGSGSIGTVTATSPAAGGAGAAAASGAPGIISTVPPVAQATGGANGSGAFPVVTVAAPAAGAGGTANGSASGNTGTISTTPPAASASGAGRANGTPSTLTLVAPQASATGAATGSGSIGTVSSFPPAITVPGGGSAMGAFGNVSFVAPTASASGIANIAAALPSLLISGPRATAAGAGPAIVDGNASGAFPVVVFRAPTAGASGRRPVTGLLAGGAAALFGEILAPLYLPATLHRVTTTYDNRGNPRRAIAGVGCLAQVNRVTAAMRNEPDFTDTDRAIFILSTSLDGEVSEGSEIEVLAGPYAGTRWKVADPIDRDPAAAYWRFRAVIGKGPV
jgi:hypothetical protein